MGGPFQFFCDVYTEELSTFSTAVPSYRYTKTLPSLLCITTAALCPATTVLCVKMLEQVTPVSELNTSVCENKTEKKEVGAIIILPVDSKVRVFILHTH